MSVRKALLLVGSAKPVGTSASEALGGYLLDQLAARGFAGETVYAHRVARSKAGTRKMLQALDASDVFVLAFPLYVDTLPHLVTQALERIAAHRVGTRSNTQPLVLAIANCGFPEASHCQVALAICRQFAVAARLQWAGGLARGAGQPLSGRKLAEAGGMARDAIPALDLAADALAAGRPIPDEAVHLMAQPMMSRRLYTAMGDAGWRWQALQNGVFSRLGAQPLAQ